MSDNYDDIERKILEELSDEFYAECDQLLQGLRHDLVALEDYVDTDRFDKNLFDNIYRTFHSLKGITGTINIDLAVTLSHKLENYLRLLCEKKVKIINTGLDTLMSATQKIEHIVSAHRNNKALPDITPLLLSIEKLVDLSDTNSTKQVSMNAESETLFQLDDDETSRIRDGLQDGRQIYRFKFTPSQELSVNGINVNVIRQRIQGIGEIVKGIPSTNEMGDVTFDFLVIGWVDPSMLDKWQKEGLKTIPHNFESLLKTDSSDTAHDNECTDPVDTKEDYPKEKADCFKRSNRATSNIIRVDLSRLDDLMQMIGDLVIERARLEDQLNQIKHIISNKNRYMLDETIQALEKKIRHLREGIMRVRMVQINEIFERMRFTIKDVTRDIHKKINLKIEGKDTEIDKLIVERMMDPIIHMVRNSISHGIESPEQRKKLNKPKAGLICLRALTSGDMVIIEIEDDGKGVDLDAIAKKAREKNIIDAQASVTLDNVLDILCFPGFSSKEKADHTSGRGVGMDVVKNAVEELGGTITVTSTYGKGTLFRIHIPLTLAILDAMIVSVGNQQFAVPKLSIQEILEVDPEFVPAAGQNEMILYRDHVLPIVRISRLFHIKEQYRRFFYVMVVQKGNEFIGIAIDRIINEREIVVHALPDSFINLKWFSGATELGDGRIVLILDVQKLSYDDMTQSTTIDHANTPSTKSVSIDEPELPLPTESYILFQLGKTTYAILSKLVKHLEMIENITFVPNMPDFIEGVVFSRGRVIPAINLRQRFGFEKIPHTIQSRLLVVNNSRHTVGLIVDNAREFVSISQEDIQPPPEKISEMNKKYIQGVTKQDHRIILLVNTEETLKIPLNTIHYLSNQYK
jgi:two-component system chemotaxis sensor kinase CheA